MIKTQSRIAMADAVEDLAPPPPPCFYNRMSWLEFLKSAATVQNMRGEPKVILIVDGEPTFNIDFDYCRDCTQIKSVQMLGKGLCNPKFLTERKEEA